MSTAAVMPAPAPAAVSVGVLSTPATTLPSASTRAAAARATAESSSNDCHTVRPFYWELGDAAGTTASGSVRRKGSTRAVTADTSLRLASATKWLYAAYVAERRGGTLTADDVVALTMRSGMVDFVGCKSGQTIDGCLAWKTNSASSVEAVGHFFYGGGHFQKHASDLGLGGLGASDLAAEMSAVLGEDLELRMAQALPSGGGQSTAAAYARFLRRMIAGELALGAWLGQAAVCADDNSEACGVGQVLNSPGPVGQTWHYAPGHWVEDDPIAGDGAYSSPGAFGFYPWIDASRTSYGIVAREAANAKDDDSTGAGVASARCGRLIRQAWTTGVAL